MNWKSDFNWAGAIELHREALSRIVAALFVMLGLDGEATVGRIPPVLHRAVLGVLRPAESALRRLIIISARGLVVKLVPFRPMPKGQMIGKGGENRPPSFQLYDTRKNFSVRRCRKCARNPPRIHFFGSDWEVTTWQARPPAAAPVSPTDGLVGASRLSRRLLALKSALEDLPGQARRMARWRVRREAAKAPKFRSPLRPGRPPGHRKKPVHEVDEVLTECHGLACWAMEPDTS